MANTIQVLSLLLECRIEGVEPLVSKLNHIVSAVKKKTYDILDHRKTEFDSDFDEFKRQVIDLELQLQSFIDSSISNMPSLLHALNLLSR